MSRSFQSLHREAVVSGDPQDRHGHDHRDRPVQLCIFGDDCSLVAVASNCSRSPGQPADGFVGTAPDATIAGAGSGPAELAAPTQAAGVVISPTQPSLRRPCRRFRSSSTMTPSTANGRRSFTGLEVSRSSMSVGHEPTLTGRSPCTGHAGHHPGARTGAAVAADRAVTFRGSGGPAAGVAVPLRCRSSSVPRRSVRRPGPGR